MKRLLIDLPSYLHEDPNVGYLLQEKVFEYLESRPTKYIKDYQIVYRGWSQSVKFIEKLIDDWDLESVSFNVTGGSNSDKFDSIKSMIDLSNEALLFFDYEKRADCMSNKILVDQCVDNDEIYCKICRLDWRNKIY